MLSLYFIAYTQIFMQEKWLYKEFEILYSYFINFENVYFFSLELKLLFLYFFPYYYFLFKNFEPFKKVIYLFYGNGEERRRLTYKINYINKKTLNIFWEIKNKLYYGRTKGNCISHLVVPPMSHDVKKSSKQAEPIIKNSRFSIWFYFKHNPNSSLLTN